MSCKVHSLTKGCFGVLGLRGLRGFRLQGALALGGVGI